MDTNEGRDTMKQGKKSTRYLLALMCFLCIIAFGRFHYVYAAEEVPETTGTPEITVTPEPTMTPEATAVPTPTDTPTEATVTPVPTLTPEATATATPVPEPVICYMTFNSDGGTEFPTIERRQTSKTNPVYWNVTLPTPEKKGYTFLTWAKASNIYVKYDNSYFEEWPVKKDVNLIARWKLNEYNITYNLKGGSFQGETPVSTYTIVSDNITFPTPVRSKYLFDGWYATSTYSGNKVVGVSSGSTGDVTIYAKWKKAAPSSASIKSISNPSGKLKITLNKVSGAAGYEIKISTDKNFKKSVATYDLGKKTSYTLTNVAKKTYYVKARAYAYDSLGKKVYSSYGKTGSKTVTKGAKEYTATSTSAKITKAKVISKESIEIKATIKKRVQSSDDLYYLVKLNPSTNKVESVVKKLMKEKSLTITLPITEGEVGNLLTKYAIAVKQKGKYTLISKPTYITNPEKSASNTSKYVLPASKKGIQGATIYGDAVDIGTKHTLINLDLKYIVGNSSKASNGGSYSAVVDGAFVTYSPYTYNGKTYYFSDYQIGTIKSYNQNNISVSAVILLSWNDDLTYLIHPSARVKGKNYYTLNSVDKTSRETLEALFCYLGETFGKSDCYISNWILGNEVNAHKVWNYAGNLSLDAYSKSYAQVFQMMYYGVKHGYSNARCFISLDNEWNKGSHGFSGKSFLTAFASAIKKENSKVAWNIAYHAYPAPLTAADFWNNTTITNNINTTAYITPKNLEVFTKYVKKTYGSKTRIILSEQGFTSSKGESIQAAALAYAYYKCQFNSMVDAFIIRSEYDVAEEVKQGLSMGLINRETVRYKEAFYVYKYMDTKYASTYTDKYLSTIGVKSWKSIVPGYSASKLKKLSN